MSRKIRKLAGARLLLVPYDDGVRGRGMGEGPLYLMEHGLLAELRSRHPRFKIDVREIKPVGQMKKGWDGVVAMNLGLRNAVVQARAGGLLPLVIGGGCLVSLGAVAGLANTEELGVLWFDAHGDLNTPEASPTGLLEGMPLALLLGRFGEKTWRKLSDQPPISPERIILAAARNLDPGEVRLAAETGLQQLDMDLLENESESDIRDALLPWSERHSGCYLHIDVDSMDLNAAPAVQYPSPGGLSLSLMQDLFETVLPLPRIRCVSVTAVYPEADRTPTTAETVVEILSSILYREIRSDSG